ncbi:MAG: acyl-CoA dehydrogenase family protein [Actinomycetes bacterium]
MDFTLTEEQTELRQLASDLAQRITPERVEASEATPENFDRALWGDLAQAGLLGISLPEEVGGHGLGLVEYALVAEQLGRAVAPVPFVWTVAAALTIARYGSDEQKSRWLPGVATGDLVLTTALPQSTADVRVDGARLTGTLVGVPYAHVAAAVLVPVAGRVYAVVPEDVTPARATSREVFGLVTLDGAAVEPIGDDTAADWLWQRIALGLAGVQTGVTDAALRMASDYTSQRKQFEKPLSSFQGVSHRLADGYVENAAIRSATLQAAWHLDEGHDATEHVLSAAWWAADGGQRCVHRTQHLHGGLGADVTYPIHRYFLWGKQIEMLLGGASALLARLGDELLDRPYAGDAVKI